MVICQCFGIQKSHFFLHHSCQCERLSRGVIVSLRPATFTMVIAEIYTSISVLGAQTFKKKYSKCIKRRKPALFASRLAYETPVLIHFWYQGKNQPSGTIHIITIGVEVLIWYPYLSHKHIVAPAKRRMKQHWRFKNPCLKIWKFASILVK